MIKMYGVLRGFGLNPPFELFFSQFNKWFALCSLQAVHTIAHLCNVEWYIDAQQKTDESLPSILSHLHKTDGLWLNPIHSNSTVSASPNQ